MSAYVSDDGVYRYSLSRDLAECDCLIPWLEGVGNHSPACASVKGGRCTFVMLNPSTADADTDDPTIRRCIAFARSWGYSRLSVVNLFAYRATDPRTLHAAVESGVDIIGPENDRVTMNVFGVSDRIVAAWGVFPNSGRAATVLSWPAKPDICLGYTKNGSPRHPLYVASDTEPVPFPFLEAAAA